MSSNDIKSLQALLRQNFAAFIEKSFGTVSPGDTYRHNWHIDAIAHHLSEVAQGKITRLIINIPPRHLKSIATSVALPAWILGRDPSRKIICVSYGQELARKHSLDTRAIMTSDWYHATFPGTVLSGEQFTQDLYSTTAKGSRLATSIGGSLTGFGGNLIIIDDPIKPADAHSDTERKRVNDWYDQTLLSRLNDKSKDAIILVMQRLHEDDLTGHLLAQSNWTHLSIPAESPFDCDYRIGPGERDLYRFEAGSVIDPEREPKAVVLDELRRTMGSRDYHAQYLQSPVPAGGNLFDWAWFKFYDPAELPPPHYVIQSWDVASSENDGADYSVCMTWGLNTGNSTLDYYLLDVVCFRCVFPELIRRARQLFEQHKADVIFVEAIGSGESFCQQLRWEMGECVQYHKPKRDKVFRAERVTPTIEQGRVFLPRNATWLNAFRNEILAFHKGKHDDQVDSMVQLLQHAKLLIQRIKSLGLSRSKMRSPSNVAPAKSSFAPSRLRYGGTYYDRMGGSFPA